MNFINCKLSKLFIIFLFCLFSSSFYGVKTGYRKNHNSENKKNLMHDKKKLIYSSTTDLLAEINWTTVKENKSDSKSNFIIWGKDNTGKNYIDIIDTSYKKNKDNKRKVKKQREYFFDYNTVEQVLLACAIFVCLAGVMFESDRFDDAENGSLVTQNRYAWQRDMITFATGFVIIFSLVYYFFVFTSEVFGFTPTFIKKMFAASAFSLAIITRNAFIRVSFKSRDKAKS